MSDGYCGECKKECNVVTVDYGIGPYEFWGAKGYDSRPADVSNCCEATVYEDEEFQYVLELPGPDDYFDEDDGLWPDIHDDPYDPW